MPILSHFGYWKNVAEKNSETAFVRSFDLNFGTELSVRDSAGALVFSHDIPTGGEMRLEDFMRLLGGRKLPLAFNIKADGLALMLKKLMEEHQIQDWFVFDMSVPELRNHILAGNPAFTRMSEMEHEPAWLDQSDGVWLDSFESDWYNNGQIEQLLLMGKRVCIVSPELRGRPHQELWQRLRPFAKNPALFLCTDYPEEAREFYFGAQS